MTHLMTRKLAVAAVAACATSGLLASGATATAAAPVPAAPVADGRGPDPGTDHRNGPTIPIQILSFNDFHGNLEPPSGSGGRLTVDDVLDAKGLAVDVTKDAGGVEYLATNLANARVGHRNTVTVAAGDLIGASPLLSAAFHDEPTIEALNHLGLFASAVGNHEFDEGYAELQRMARGGCLPDGDGADNQNSCAANEFEGADFAYLAANVRYAGSKRTILPSYAIKTFNGAKVGFIGMTLKETPTIVTAAGVKGLEFADEVATANALVPVLKRKGVNAIVVLVHQGGVPGKQTWTDPATGKIYSVNPTYDYTCGKGGALTPDSPILPIAKNLDPAIDLVISGHTHQPYVCDVPDRLGHSRLVTSASSFGRLFTETDLVYDRRTQDFVRASVAGSNVIVSREVPKDPWMTSLIATYKALVMPIASKVIGGITADVTRTSNPAGESPLGDLIADAQLADPSVVTGGIKPVIAFMNPGGIRADLTVANSPYGENPGDITFDEAFTVQPFNNYLVSMDLTGQQIYDLLGQQYTGLNSGSSVKVLQVSKGFAYTRSGSTVVDGSVTLGGVPLVKAATYRVVTNNFLSDGGDNFAAFGAGTSKYFGGLDIEAFATYLPTVTPYSPASPTRISGQ